MSGELINEAYTLRQRFPKTSVNDLLALVLAKYEQCPLLTSDKTLREVSEKLNTEAHGTLWLVEKMIRSQKITPELAHVSFQRMRKAGSRLPWGEVEKLLMEWSEVVF